MDLHDEVAMETMSGHEKAAMTAERLKSELAGYHGTQSYYRGGPYPMVLTEGARRFADLAGAYWLMDIIGTEVAAELAPDFASITMTVRDSGSATIIADDGNGGKLWQREIEWTDCPPGDWKFFLCGGVLMLPSEY